MSLHVTVNISVGDKTKKVRNFVWSRVLRL